MEEELFISNSYINFLNICILVKSRKISRRKAKGIILRGRSDIRKY